EMSLPHSAVECALAVPLMLAVILLTVIGNTLVILAVFTSRALRQAQNFLIVSLACADMAVGLLVQPLQVKTFLTDDVWLLPRFVCTVFTMSDIFFCTASILNLAAIAVDRYCAIKYPIMYANKRTTGTVLMMIGAAFGLSGAISFGPLLSWTGGGTMKNNTKQLCQLPGDGGYIVFSALGSFYLPAAVIAGLYISIYLALRRRLRRRAAASAVSKFSQVTAMPTPLAQRRPKKAIKEDEEEDNEADDDEDLSSQRLRPPPVELRADSASEAAESEAEPEAGSLAVVGGGSGLASACSHQQSLQVPPRRQPRLAVQLLAPGGHEPASAATSVQEHSRARQKISLSRERRALRTLGIIMGIFILCWLPFFLVYLAGAWGYAPEKRLFRLFVWLGYVNSALNPVIYTVFNADFRRAFARLLRLSAAADSSPDAVRCLPCQR
uniref:G_PROTEIN_RECEP_F1_2 domain-containing protein n=1 Tax=Macrostomum lignano TaxID=282301 RepID=A0A1I8GEK6_9PLAT